MALDELVALLKRERSAAALLALSEYLTLTGHPLAQAVRDTYASPRGTTEGAVQAALWLMDQPQSQPEAAPTEAETWRDRPPLF